MTMATPLPIVADVPLRAFKPRHKRRILLVFPKYSYSFGTFNHAFKLLGVKAFMPPQGILLIAALIPRKWEVKLIDENIHDMTPEDLAWADVVFTSGMHIQKKRLHDIIRRAHKAGKAVAIGGPSVSSAPEYYPDADFLHCGEVGDSTLRLFQHLDETVERPEQQLTFQTVERMPMTDFPSPAYHLIRLTDYLLGSIQYSSGCPFTCEFCDIPALYGRNPRLKSPEQIINELDQLADGGCVSVYFVDDNFIGNPKATETMLPHIIEWQKKRDYAVRLSCEATLNMSGYTRTLEMMREAFFTNVYFGIETPEAEALKAMKKTQNLRSPIIEALEKFNSYGIEVASGIIMGLDTDTDATAQAMKDFADAGHVPIMTVNILYALPKTALYDRLMKAGRVIENADDRDSNVDFLIPYEEVVARWKDVIGYIYDATNLYARYAHNASHTYIHRVTPKNPLKQLTWANIKRGVGSLARIIWYCGLRSHYKKVFWKMFWTEMKRGQVENVFQIAMVAHHLIVYSRECLEGKLQASNYSERDTDANPQAERMSRMPSPPARQPALAA
jgi:radical SAM superfamily enzyme YgiQ (UPF0313 family)